MKRKILITRINLRVTVMMKDKEVDKGRPRLHGVFGLKLSSTLNKVFIPGLQWTSQVLAVKRAKKSGRWAQKKTAGMKLAKEWVTSSVTSSATGLQKQKRALRKKICEHGKTKSHVAAESILEKAKDDTLPTAVINYQCEHEKTTARVFRTAYKEAKRHRPAYGFEHEIDCQELNGLEMGRILHSNVSCSNIQQHISSEMRGKLLDKIVECAPKIALLLDEATGLNKKSALIVYLRLQLPDMKSPENIFLDLVELEDLSAEGIVHELLACLKKS